MRNVGVHIAALLLLSACNRPVEKPVWLQPQPIITYPDVQLQFTSAATNWSAALVSVVQPIPLAIQYHSNGFAVHAEHNNGILEGPAQICLSSGNQYFYYPVSLVNKDGGAVTQKDYRSPKTVNPDSSLLQQRILHAIDQYRNLVYPVKTAQYFPEAEMMLSPKAGNYRAISDEPLSAYYIQPGSCISIPVRAMYNREKEQYEVTAGPLKDKYGNTVANGTAVAFIYTGASATHRVEAALLNGYATVYIPATATFTLAATVNETKSATIQLTR